MTNSEIEIWSLEWPFSATVYERSLKEKHRTRYYTAAFDIILAKTKLGAVLTEDLEITILEMTNSEIEIWSLEWPFSATVHIWVWDYIVDYNNKKA